jgi:Chlorhexidine efflux transporter
MAMGGHGFWRALAIDIGLTLFYAVYAYGFHLVYDRLRPVSRAPAAILPRANEPRPMPPVRKFFWPRHPNG